MEYFLKQIILAFVTAGGYGYINYFILDNLNLIDTLDESSDNKKVVIVLFSIINLLLSFFFSDILKLNIVFSVLMTLVLTIAFSLTLFPRIIELYIKYMSKIRSQTFGSGRFCSKSVKTILFDKNEVLFVYIYDLRTDKLLVHGCMGWENQKSKDYEFSVYPYPGLEKLTFDEAIEKSRKNEDEEIYVNVDKQIKIVVIPEPK